MELNKRYTETIRIEEVESKVIDGSSVHKYFCLHVHVETRLKARHYLCAIRVFSEENHDRFSLIA